MNYKKFKLSGGKADIDWFTLRWRPGPKLTEEEEENLKEMLYAVLDLFSKEEMEEAKSGKKITKEMTCKMCGGKYVGSIYKNDCFGEPSVGMIGFCDKCDYRLMT